MTEAQFCFDILNEPLFVRSLEYSSFADRPRLVSAFRRLIRAAGKGLNVLAGEVFVIAPPKDTTGVCFNFDREDSPNCLIYISPFTDEASKASADYTVAHEFAHAVAHTTGTDRGSTECVCGKQRDGDCECEDCECAGCHNYEMALTPDADKTPEEYVNCIPEYAADELVLSWGYKLPVWKSKIRKPRGPLGQDSTDDKTHGGSHVHNRNSSQTEKRRSRR